MKKSLILLLIIFTASFAWERRDAADNWSGTDTSNTAFLYAKYDTTKFSRVFKLTAGENVRLIVKANDTTTARFGSDSLGFVYGYQTLCPCRNFNDVVDSCVDQTIKIDSMAPALFCNIDTVRGSIGVDGTYNRSLGYADTVHCTGYAVQSRNFTPEWDVYIRLWVKGIGNNKKTVAVPVNIDVQRRVYSQVRDR